MAKANQKFKSGDVSEKRDSTSLLTEEQYRKGRKGQLASMKERNVCRSGQ